MSHEGRVFLFIHSCIIRIKCSGNITAQHLGIFQCSTHIQLTVLTKAIHYLSYGVFKEAGMLTGCTNASNLFLINQQCHSRTLNGFCFQLCHHRGICTDAIIMPVSGNHTAIQPVVSCLSSRYDLDFRRYEIILFKIIFFLQQLQNIRLNSILFLASQRHASDRHIQVFPLDDIACLFAHLIRRQMYQQITDSYDWIIIILTDIQLNHRFVLLHDYTMQRQWQGNPLILFDTAVIMRIQHREFLILIQRILFDIQTRRIHVCSQNIASGSHRLLTDQKQGNSLAHIVGIHLVTAFQRFFVFDDILQITISIGFRNTDTFAYAFTLCLAVGNIFFVSFAIIEYFL